MRKALIAALALSTSWAVLGTAASAATKNVTLEHRETGVRVDGVYIGTSQTTVRSTLSNTPSPAAPQAHNVIRPVRTVASPRPSDANAASVSHNFTVPHPLPYLRGLRSNHELAQKIRENLAAHPEGTTILDPAQCRANGSCAAPKDWLASFREKRPDLTLEKLADYIDSLVPHHLTAEEAAQQWDMDCLTRGDNGTYTTVIRCGNRAFHKGEIAYADLLTHEFVLAEDCANPTRGRHQNIIVPASPCGELDYPEQPGDVIRLAVATSGPPVPEGECSPAIKPAGEDEYLSGWFDQCADVACTFADDVAAPEAQGRRIGRQASYRSAAVGTGRVRVPLSFTQPGSPYRIWVCRTRNDQHSDVMEVEPTSYLGRLHRAKLYETRDEVPAGDPVLYYPVGVYHSSGQ